VAKIEAAIRDAVARGARKQVRMVVQPLRREVRRLRQAVGQLRRDVAELRDAALAWRRTAGASRWTPAVSAAELRSSRLSPRLIQKLRRRLGVSQHALGRLVGVSGGAVVQWERGRSTPSEQNRGQLIGLRKLGRRDVKRLLATMPQAAGKGAGRRRRRPRRRPK
jgi:DNA-binding transcriptional regulator YiaG